MAAGQRLNDGDVVKLEKNIVERYDSIKGQLSRLQGTLDTMEANWRGIGAKAFNDKQVEINERVKHIGSLLTWFLDNINATRKDKDKLEDEVRATMSSIDVQQGGAHSALNSY
ncbi:WXG100 family type VII secretion target [Streptomyces sp. NPDC002888]|uniref:WXG100 family type VII secretion target n=1 Tax=Streptomyces sp. NPDC002888 TaxID=3364668 RepID=UPI0036BEB74D